jgi:hypothetical protein
MGLCEPWGQGRRQARRHGGTSWKYGGTEAAPHAGQEQEARAGARRRRRRSLGARRTNAPVVRGATVVPLAVPRASFPYSLSRHFKFSMTCEVGKTYIQAPFPNPVVLDTPPPKLRQQPQPQLQQPQSGQEVL